jgi:hypothetical protein
MPEGEAKESHRPSPRFPRISNFSDRYSLHVSHTHRARVAIHRREPLPNATRSHFCSFDLCISRDMLGYVNGFLTANDQTNFAFISKTVCSVYIWGAAPGMGQANLPARLPSMRLTLKTRCVFFTLQDTLNFLVSGTPPPGYNAHIDYTKLVKALLSLKPSSSAMEVE